MQSITPGASMMRAALVSALCVAFLACSGPAAPPPDASVTRACAVDADCDDHLYCTGPSSCVEGTCTASAPTCGTVQLCDENGRRCVTECTVARDADGDGVDATECGGLDCDDSDPQRAPGRAEVCDVDAHDEDCDPTTFGFRDQDGDDHPDAACCNVASSGDRICGDDCNDIAASVHPTQVEVCNAVDDDCDAATDEGLLIQVYPDGDGDGHGSSGASASQACMLEPGFARIADDCDDADANRFPGNPEVCDEAMLDEDCSGAGNDVPGGCACTYAGGAPESCGTMGICAGATHACSMDGVWSPCTAVPATEVCDGAHLDEDCDGSVDEMLTVICYRDGDGDGYAPDGAAPTSTCASSDASRAGAPWNRCPVGTTGRAPGVGTVDCCDSDGRAHPGAGAQTSARACGGYDFNCDGVERRTSVGRTLSCSSIGDMTTCNHDVVANGSGWCDGPPACGQSGGHGSCYWIGNACYRQGCLPTTMPCD